jgi:hypothetical protein
MKRCFYMLGLFLLLIVPVPGQKNESLRYACRTQCVQKLETCRQEAHGDGPKKAECEKKYRACLNWCANPPRSTGD